MSTVDGSEIRLNQLIWYFKCSIVCRVSYGWCRMSEPSTVCPKKHYIKLLLLNTMIKTNLPWNPWLMNTMFAICCSVSTRQKISSKTPSSFFTKPRFIKKWPLQKPWKKMLKTCLSTVNPGTLKRTKKEIHFTPNRRKKTSLRSPRADTHRSLTLYAQNKNRLASSFRESRGKRGRSAGFFFSSTKTKKNPGSRKPVQHGKKRNTWNLKQPAMYKLKFAQVGWKLKIISQMVV